MKCPYCDSYNIVYTEVTDTEQDGDILKREIYNRCECGETFMTTERYKLEDEDYLYEK